MPKQLVRICPSDSFCRAQNLPTSSFDLIWPITELYFRQILSTDFMNRFYLDVCEGCATTRGCSGGKGSDDTRGYGVGSGDVGKELPRG